MNWLKLHPKIKIQAFAVLALIGADVLNQITQFYPHATWLPLVSTVGLVVLGYLKSSTTKDAP